MLGQNRFHYIQRGQTCNASITVEAVFVLPIVFLAVFSILYLTFYLHDICRVQGIVDEALHRAGLCMKYEADLASSEIDYDSIKKRGVYDILMGESTQAEQKLQMYLQQKLAKGLFLSQVVYVQAAVGKTKVEISVKTESRISIPWISRFFKDYSHTMISGEYPIHDPAQTIRVCEVILDTASKVKGVAELRNKIERFFPGD